MTNAVSQSLMSETIVCGLQGTGGCARGIMPLLSAGIEEWRSLDARNRLLVYVEPAPRERTVNGYPVLSEDEFVGLVCYRKYFNVGIANSATRRSVYDRYRNLGFEALPIRAQTSIVFGDSNIGDGAVLSPFTTVAANTTIGKMFHLNLYAYVEHDCVIGDFVTFAPGVKCNGNVHIHDHAYIGSGAVLKQGTPDRPLVIGAGATVGMGAVVTKDVEPHATVVGNPARPISSASPSA
jgi:sugar O-acyltransferase (sialic acid O-acetyltransferase NeuD family)